METEAVTQTVILSWIAAVMLYLLFGATACGVQMGTVSYWEQYNRSLMEANTAQRPGVFERRVEK